MFIYVQLPNLERLVNIRNNVVVQKSERFVLIYVVDVFTE